MCAVGFYPPYKKETVAPNKNINNLRATFTESYVSRSSSHEKTKQPQLSNGQRQEIERTDYLRAIWNLVHANSRKLFQDLQNGFQKYKLIEELSRLYRVARSNLNKSRQIRIGDVQQSEHSTTLWISKKKAPDSLQETGKEPVGERTVSIF